MFNPYPNRTDTIRIEAHPSLNAGERKQTYSLAVHGDQGIARLNLDQKRSSAIADVAQAANQSRVPTPWFERGGNLRS